MARTRYGFAAVLGLLPTAWPVLAHAQSITIDGRLSPAQTLTGPNYTIGANLGQQRGPNLFHSFGRFGVAPGETATFTGPAGITNVIGRVTGGNPSTIAGTLRSTVVGANVTLINPAGIAVTQGARIDVPGAFRVSTADEVRFADGARFSATNPNGSTLTHAPPVAFGFLGPAQPITITGATIDAGGIGVAGGAVTISGGTLSAPGGEIRIAATAGAGEVKLERGGPPATVTAWAPVRIDGGAVVSATDTAGGAGGRVRVRGSAVTVSNARLAAEAGGAGPAGSIKLRGSSLTVDRGGAISADSFGTGIAGSVDVTLDGAISLVGNGTRYTTVTADGYGSGPAGTVRVSAASLGISGYSYLTADGVGDGAAGLVDVQLSGALDVVGNGRFGFTGISTSSYGNGAAGTLLIQAAEMSVRAEAIRATAFVGADNSGNAAPGVVRVRTTGGLTVESLAAGSFAAVRANGFGSGGAGTTTILAGTDVGLSARCWGVCAVIGADSYGSGPSGLVDITAGGTVRAAGSAAAGAFAQFIATTNNRGSGAGGTVRIRAHNLELSEQGDVVASNFGSGAGTGAIDITLTGDLVADGGSSAARILAYSDRGATGPAGTIRIDARDVILRDGGRIEGSSAGAADSASIELTARGLLFTSDRFRNPYADGNPSGVINDTWGGSTGNVGRMTVRAGRMELHAGGISSSTHGAGLAGTIEIDVTDRILLDMGGLNGGIGASTFRASGDGGGGSVRIRAGELVLRNGTEIQASTTQAGNGGNIDIAVRGTMVMEQPQGAFYNTIISTQTNFWEDGVPTGNAGRVSVQASNLLIRDGAQISSSTRTSDGNAGGVSVNVSGTLDIAGTSAGLIDGLGRQMAFYSSGVFSDASAIDRFNPPGAGSAGDVTVNTGSLRLSGGGAIATSTAGVGNAGNVRVNASTISIGAGSEIASSTSAAGRGGNVIVNAGDLSLAGAEARIAASSTGTGDAGEILVVARNLSVRDGAAIASSARSADGGNIIILVPRDTGLLRLDNASITASVAGGAGGGGNIFIDPLATILTNGSTIAGNAFGGPGGNITLQTTYLFVGPTSSITASSALGIQGSVVLNTTPVDPASTLATLPSDLRAASAVLREACAARSGTSVASLVVGTPGGLPFTPEGPLPSTYLAGRPLFDEPTAPGGLAQAPAPAAITPMARCG